jgi:hypothetical protein
MQEIQIFKMLVATVPPLVQARTGSTGQIAVMQAYQPQQTGLSKLPTLALSVVMAKRYGWRKSAARWDAAASIMRNYEAQPMETTIQFTMQATATGDPNGPTETDRLQFIADAVQSDVFIAQIRPAAQVLRVTDVRTGRFIGDNGQHMNWPSFDLTIKHTREYVDGIPAVSAWDGLNVYAVV